MPTPRLPSLRLFLCVLLSAFGFSSAPAQLLTVDASASPAAPTALPFPIGGADPAGHTFSANSRYLTLDGKPWFPVMGEFHYARYPASEWETELLKMKAGGITVVSTYIFWIFHEETEGRFNWQGDRDLRAFLQLCAKHGLYVWIRIGPWDHGEVRNGGFPDWLLKIGDPKNLRTNDPAYLDRVTKFYNQIGLQAKGLMWKDGGPVIGVQIENEYHPGSGPGRGVEHINTLLGLAHAAGLDAPFYSITGWDRAAVPATGFLPVFGGYTEQFWSASLTDLPPNQNFFFTNIRAEDNVMGDLSPKSPGQNSKYDGFPFLTAEMGGGMAIAYHRRPVLFGDDSASAALVKLGAGANGLGFYMYHGGTNPDGLTSLQETQSQPDHSGYNDMEQKSYDFQGPLGEFGQAHDAFFSIKTLALFLDEFGSQLAPMSAYFPDLRPKSRSDTTTPRVAVRSDGHSAFVFINNYQRTIPLAAHDNFQVSLKLADNSTVLIPQSPTTVPSGAYAIWPVNLDLNGVTLRYATAQLLTKIPGATADDPDTYVFFASPGTQPEFAFAPDANVTAVAPSAQSAKAAMDDILKGVLSQAPTAAAKAIASLPVAQTFVFTPSPSPILTLQHPGSHPAQILLLSRDDALHLYRASLLGSPRVALSPATTWFSDDQIYLSSADRAKLTVGIYPPIRSNISPTLASSGFIANGNLGLFQKLCRDYDTLAAPPDLAPNTTLPTTPIPFTLATPAGASVPAALNPNPKRHIALEPSDADFARAAAFSLTFTPEIIAAISSGNFHAHLLVNYVGDVARLYAGDRLITDNFYKGTPFDIGLWRCTPAELTAGLTLKILPLRADTPLYLPASARPDFKGQPDILAVNSISLVWHYEAALDLSSAAGGSPPATKPAP